MPVASLNFQVYLVSQPTTSVKMKVLEISKVEWEHFESSSKLTRAFPRVAVPLHILRQAQNFTITYVSNVSDSSRSSLWTYVPL
jgi:hypothetical protein